MARRLALIAIPVAALVVGGTALARGDSAAAPAATDVVAPVKVSVSAVDYSFRLSKRTVPKGKPIVFTLTNRGRTVHDFDFPSRKGTPIIAPGKKATLRITFPKKGRYQYYCSVPRHAELGMTGFLAVK